MRKLVGYFDILGTKSMIKQYGNFNDIIFRDFGAAASLIVNDSPGITLDAFSDCILITSRLSQYYQFVNAVRKIYLQWIADYILVRGGIAIGDFNRANNPANTWVARNSNITFISLWGSFSPSY